MISDYGNGPKNFVKRTVTYIVLLFFICISIHVGKLYLDLSKVIYFTVFCTVIDSSTWLSKVYSFLLWFAISYITLTHVLQSFHYVS